VPNATQGAVSARVNIKPTSAGQAGISASWSTHEETIMAKSGRSEHSGPAQGARSEDSLAAPEGTRIVERPNGFFWCDQDTGAEFGPFDSLAEALADANAGEEADLALAPGSALHEIEEEIGLADWIDPDTGSPAEGYAPHIEDH
jgi:hypothetical protein